MYAADHQNSPQISSDSFDHLQEIWDIHTKMLTQFGQAQTQEEKSTILQQADAFLEEKKRACEGAQSSWITDAFQEVKESIADFRTLISDFQEQKEAAQKEDAEHIEAALKALQAKNTREALVFIEKLHDRGRQAVLLARVASIETEQCLQNAERAHGEPSQSLSSSTPRSVRFAETGAGKLVRALSRKISRDGQRGIQRRGRAASVVARTPPHAPRGRPNIPPLTLSSELTVKRCISEGPSDGALIPQLDIDHESARLTDSESDEDEDEDGANGRHLQELNQSAVGAKKSSSSLHSSVGGSFMLGATACALSYVIFRVLNRSHSYQLKKLIRYFDFNNIDHQRKAHHILLEIELHLQKHMFSFPPGQQQHALALADYIDFVKDTPLTREVLIYIANSAEQLGC